MSLAVVTLKKGEGRFLKSGGLWVYDNEIATIMGSFVNGDIVLVHDFDGYPMGRGFINTNSKITVRMLTRDEHKEINEEFLRQRVRDAWEYRKKLTQYGMKTVPQEDCGYRKLSCDFRRSRFSSGTCCG